MVLNKILYDMREMIRQYTDDSEISDRLLIHRLGIKRAKFLRQEENNFQRTTDIINLQSLCLDLEKVSPFNCGIEVDCEEILRTTQPIPKPLALHIGVSITNVRPSNRIAIPFNFTSKERAIYSQYSPFNGSIYAFLDVDGYIYILGNNNALNLLECINITGIFEDPLELSNYSNCCGCSSIENPCIDLDTIDYPLVPHLIDTIKLEIVNELIQQLQIPEDKINDAND